jgi:hypothetical protein
MKYHPDKTSDPEAPEKFLLVQKAKEILLDSTKRKVIDDHREATAKREAYERQKNQSMDARRKRMRDEFNERLSKATSQQHVPSEAKIFQNELKKRSKIIEDLRKQNKDLMERSRDEAISKESQQAENFLNYRRSVVESATGDCCQLKVKWKRTAESHSDESLYQMFKVFGPVEEAVLVGSKGTSGLVTFTDAASAMKAYEHFKHSEDYRVTFLTDGLSADKGPAPGVRNGVASAQQSELSTDIRRAMEKKSLETIINQFKRPSGADLAGSAQAGVQEGAEKGTDAPAAAPKVTPASLASKESEILQRMMEAAQRKKAQSAAANS